MYQMASRRPRIRRRVETNDTDDDYVLNFDQTRFPSEIAANRFTTLRNRKLIAERKVHLNEGEFANFNNEIMRRNWHMFLANPPDEIDDTLVREFYANAYQVDRDGDRQSMARSLTMEHSGEDAMMYMYAQNDALRRGQMCLMDNMHRLSLGIPDFPDDSVMTATQFEEHVPWPEDRPTFVRGRENQAPQQQPDEEEADQQGHNKDWIISKRPCVHQWPSQSAPEAQPEVNQSPSDQEPVAQRASGPARAHQWPSDQEPVAQRASRPASWSNSPS
ncbi:uncharacterized protein HKW66_Vig0203700 [Vigna angularis]|uniref:Uncharacterized protein n=1 Tax=Phaseolus angularis TaxID=3914 RepID=A0A8T0JV17_PHAAN|nr:uncharacterized protein HKW66_Vig0203700 [Vigna angularis]